MRNFEEFGLVLELSNRLERSIGRYRLAESAHHCQPQVSRSHQLGSQLLANETAQVATAAQEVSKQPIQGW